MPSAPLKIFCSYSHKDEDIMNQLRVFLAGLRRQHLIEDWHDRQIPAGGDWDKLIKQNLDSADIILLLISADFIASSYCMDLEVARALQREQRGEARVIPIFARECPIKNLSFEYLQGTPRDCQWITQQKSSDKAYSEVVQTIGEVVVEMLGVEELAKNPDVILHQPIKKNSPHKKIAVAIGVLLIIVAAYFYFKPTATQANLWDALLDQGEYAQAQKLCKQASDTQPDSPAVKQCLAITALMLDDTSSEVFEETANRLMGEYPHSPYPLLIQAELNAAEEEWDNAETQYQQALDINPDIPQAYFGLGQIAQFHYHKLADAQEYYEKAVKLAPKNSRFRHNLASIYAESKDYAKSAEHYKRLLATDKDMLLAYVEWVNVLLYQGLFSKAFNLSDELQAVLNQQGIWAKELNKIDWAFTTEKKTVYLQTQQEKERYIKLQHSLTAILAADDKELQAIIKPLDGVTLDGNLSYLLTSDVQRLKAIFEKSPAVQQRLKQFQVLIEGR